MTAIKFIKVATLIVMGAQIIIPLQSVKAQEILPEIPAPLQNLVNEGAQIRYLGKDEGVDGWIVIKNGVEQYFYVLPDSGAFLTGVLFDKAGKTVTVEQVRRLRGAGNELLDSLAGEITPKPSDADPKKSEYEFKSPAEQLFADIENSNWIPVGKAGTPVFYTFVDPQCPHCHNLMSEMKEYIDKGQAQVRLIPIGFKEETMAQAAFLLAAPDPAALWWRNMEGDATALPAKSEINQQGVQRNLAIMQSWKIDATPTLIYRAKDKSIKIVRGKPKVLKDVLDDLGARS